MGWVASSAAFSAANAGPSTWITRSLAVQPHSCCANAKNSSACASSASPSWLRNPARCSGPASAHGPESKAFLAAAIALSTWAWLGSGADAITASVAGLTSS